MADGLVPYSVEAERAVVGALLLDPDSTSTAITLSRVEPSAFFDDECRWVMEASDECLIQGQTPTMPALSQELSRMGRDVDLSQFISETFTAVGVEAHLKIVIDTYRRRQVITEAGRIAQRAFDKGPALESIQYGLDNLGKLLSEKDAGMERLGYSDWEQKTGYDWYLPALDKHTTGMAPGKLTILAGPSGLGKSMVAGHMVRSCAQQDGRAAIFTMEMANAEYQSRLASAVAGVYRRKSKWELENKPYTDAETALMESARGTVQDWDVYARDKSGITLGEITASVKTINADKHVDLVVVDYLQLMGGINDDNTAQGLKAITGGLKNMAMELGCHVVVVSQMNRAGLNELRGRESLKGECIITGESYPIPVKEFLMGGAVENDADLVVMLAQHNGERCRPQKHIEVCVVKNRNGGEGHSMMISNFDICRIDSISDQECYRIASGNMAISTALRIDQGHWRA